MMSHVKGVKHMKKENALRAEKEERYRKGEPDKMAGPSVIPIPHPEKTKLKVPIHLHDKIKETRDPVIGLDYIKEYIAVSDCEAEPHYKCDLCGNQGIANGMFLHLMGQKHHQWFLEVIYEDDQTPYMDLTQGDLFRYAREFAENTEDLKKKYGQG